MSSQPLFEVRVAVHEDAEALRLLELEARSAIAEFRGFELLLVELPIVGDSWSAFLQHAQRIVLVAQASSQIIAYGYADVDTLSHHCLVRHIFVVPQARQLGIGASLITQIASTAKQMHCTTLDGFALPGDRKMKNLYERVGMPARLIVASKNI